MRPGAAGRELGMRPGAAGRELGMRPGAAGRYRISGNGETVDAKKPALGGQME